MCNEMNVISRSVIDAFDIYTLDYSIIARRLDTWSDMVLRSQFTGISRLWSIKKNAWAAMLTFPGLEWLAMSHPFQEG